MASTTATHASTGGVRLEILGDPQALPEAIQTQLTDELYAVHSEIFDGVDRDAFCQYVMRPPGSHRALHVLRDSTGRAVGYLSLHCVLRRCLGRRAVIIRGAVGLLPAFRRQNHTGRAQARYILRLRLRFPSRRLYGFLCPVSPSMYAMSHRALAEFWPSPSSPTPPEVGVELASLGRVFGLTAVGSDRPGVFRVGWRVRDAGPIDLGDPATRFYVDRNPAFAAGNGLAVLCPLHFRNIIHGLRRVARKRRGRVRSET